MKLGRYSFGTGDRFAHQGNAQLKAITKACDEGVCITPVWNKSHREHTIIHSSQKETRKEADQAVEESGWERAYFVDADHINMNNVDEFLDYSDFFTIDVAGQIGVPADDERIEEFAENNRHFIGSLKIEGIDETFEITESLIQQMGSMFLNAATEVKKVYRHIADAKNSDEIVIEVSMDEVEQPQTPVELFFILKMLSDLEVPVDTIAPKFTGRFNKGVDYKGDTKAFAREFEQDLMVIDHAVREFGLPAGLKLSMHSGSDKFSLYPLIHSILNRHGKGIHVKTSGTTWLEELIGLSLAGSVGLEIAKEIYRLALERYDELTGPYKPVLDITKSKLPDYEEMKNWSGEAFAHALRHDQNHPQYNPHFRQLLHCAYKVAAEMGEEFTSALKKYEDTIAPNVTENLYDRHIKPLFMGVE